jgi:hypothetical protein
MHPITKSPTSLAALCLALAAAPALAGDDCDVPVARWQPREAALAQAQRQGWQVRRLKIDDGCYEIRGRDAQGREFEAKLDPETLDVVKMKQRKSHDRDRRRGERSERQQSAPAPANPLLTPGAAPRGQIE